MSLQEEVDLPIASACSKAPLPTSAIWANLSQRNPCLLLNIKEVYKTKQKYWETIKQANNEIVDVVCFSTTSKIP